MASFKIIDCNSVAELWEAISPIGPYFSSESAGFIFRGQSDSSWPLSPGVYREGVIDRYKRGLIRSMKDHPGQTFFEWLLLDDFVHFCDLRGLAIPGDSMDFRRYISLDSVMGQNGISNVQWPQDRIVPLMALAQHHRVPTRLLDWSNSSYVAAYFAAADVVEKGGWDDNKRLAIFGFAPFTGSVPAGFRHVRVPGSTTVNLSAQSGSFVLVNNHGHRGEDFTPGVSLEQRIAEFHGQMEQPIKLTLPQRLAGELLLLCMKFGVSAASLFPGYDGAAMAVLHASSARALKEKVAEAA